MRATRGLLLLLALGGSSPLAADLPPVPVPVENPITEPKRVLGKILFWDEQLSSDGTVACGTCHRPGAGGGDPRAARHPGIDKGTIDDVAGSPGIASLGRDGQPQPHALFGTQPQVTPRLSPSNFGALWADELFWDGRAGPELKDPLTGKVAIARGGALENQALAALLNDSEMAQAGPLLGRRRDEARKRETPRAGDAVAARHGGRHRAPRTYPALFAAAFGDEAITPTRIAFALATYQRTLVGRRDAVGPIRRRRHDGALGPRALRLARSASVSLHGVPHAAAVHEQRLFPDRRAPRRFRSRPARTSQAIPRTPAR